MLECLLRCKNEVKIEMPCQKRLSIFAFHRISCSFAKDNKSYLITVIVLDADSTYKLQDNRCSVHNPFISVGKHLVAPTVAILVIFLPSPGREPVLPDG